MLPNINLVGRLTADPEMRYSNSGMAIASFNIASSEKYKDKEKVCFINCTSFGALAEKVIMPYLKKGSQVYISGKLNFEQWTDKEGKKQSKHTISVDNLQMLGSRDDNTNSQPQRQQHQTQKQYNRTEQPPEISDNEIPF